MAAGHSVRQGQCIGGSKEFYTSKMSAGKQSILIDNHNIRDIIKDKTGHRAVWLRDKLEKIGETAWHRFTIYNEGLDMQDYERNFVLKTVTDFVYPDILLPVYYEEANGKCFFLARNCMNAIYRLIDEDLMITNPWNVEAPFKVKILVNISNTTTIPVPDAELNLTRVIKKRMLDDKILNLERFWEDQDLHQFCPLSQPKLLVYVLFLANKFNPEMVVLCNNDIRQFPPMDLLLESRITSINLKHNLITDLESIKCLQDLKFLRELHLDENPVCAKFDNEFNYFYTVKRVVCRNLEKLDGRRLINRNGLPTQQDTFLCNRNDATLVNKFLEYFFDSYDNNRDDLEFLYDANAVFSLSYRIIRDKLLPMGFTYAPHYQYRRQNLLDKLQLRGRYTDYGKSTILNSVLGFPKTRHNPHTFKVDLMLSTAHFAVVCVSGIFDELDENLGKTESFAFNRTFVLNAKTEKTWTILNDQLHVYHPVVSVKLLDVMLPPPSERITLPDNEIPSNKEKHDLVKAFQKLTGLSDTFCEDYLYKTMDRFDEALEVFIEDYKNDILPINAFRDPSEEETKNEKDREFKGSLFVEYASENPIKKPVVIVLDDDTTSDTNEEPVKNKPVSNPSSSKKPVASVAPNRQPAAAVKMQIKPTQNKIVPNVFDLSGKANSDSTNFHNASSSDSNSLEQNNPSKKSKRKKKKVIKYHPPKPADLLEQFLREDNDKIFI